ncbi:MAG: hypothetical protein NTW75_11070 [Planctomycetales bacterium]|jgi:hypothetical protein|nr:hypothetical protein [Planctomycetales bacterium]
MSVGMWLANSTPSPSLFEQKSRYQVTGFSPERTLRQVAILP